MAEVEVKVRAGARERCPYCHDGLEGGQITDARVECPGCGTTHHRACLEELGGCTVLGCSGGAPAPVGGVVEIRARVRDRMQRFGAHLSVPDASAYERLARHWTCSGCELAFAVDHCPSCGAELRRRCTIFGDHCSGCARRFLHGQIVGLVEEDSESEALRRLLQRCVLGLVLVGFAACVLLVVSQLL